MLEQHHADCGKFLYKSLSPLQIGVFQQRGKAAPLGRLMYFQGRMWQYFSSVNPPRWLPLALPGAILATGMVNCEQLADAMRKCIEAGAKKLTLTKYRR